MSPVLSLLAASWTLTPGVPPPKMAPVIQVEFDAQNGRPARVLEVFDGEFQRADWIDKATGKVNQRFWSKDEGKQFAEVLKGLKLPPRGKSAVASDSPEGKKLLEAIDAMIVQPAKKKQAETEAKQKELRDADRPPPKP